MFIIQININKPNCLRLVGITRLLPIIGKVKPISSQRNFWNVLLNSSKAEKISWSLINFEKLEIVCCSSSQYYQPKGLGFILYKVR